MLDKIRFRDKVSKVVNDLKFKENKEILLATILFILCPILSLPLQFYFLFKNEKYRGIYMFYISVIIGIVYMNTTPNKYFDLFRYYIKMDVLKEYDFSEIFNYIKGNLEPFMNIIFYIFAISGAKEFIVLFSAIVFYNLYFYMFFDYANKIKLDKKAVNFLIIAFMIVNSITETIMCIRYALGCIIFAYAIYIDYVKEKKQWYYKLIYIVPLLIHNSMIVFLVIRLLMIFNKEKLNKFIVIMLILASIFPSFILIIMKNLPDISFVKDLMGGLSYLTSNVEFNNYKLLNTVINLFISILVIDIYRKNSKNKIAQLSMLYLIPALGLILGQTITERLYIIIVLIITFPAIEYYKKIEYNFINKKNIIIYLGFLGCLIFKFRSQIIMLNNSNGINKIMENGYKNLISLIIEHII